jgi:branched-chain amino acid transport system ATP-binding protein
MVDDPVLVLLDEPTSGLDQEESHRLAGMIDLLSTQRRCAILLVEHDIGFVMGACGRVTVLNTGQVIAEGSPEEIRSDPVVRAVYLDVP